MSGNLIRFTTLHLLCCKMKQLFYWLYKSDFLEPTFYFFPLINLLFSQSLCIGTEVLMQGGQQENLSGWDIHKLSQFLQEIEFLFWIVLCCMLQYLSKFVNDNQ